MATSVPKPPRRAPGDLEAPYVAGDAIPAPEAVEGGESAWALWSEVNRQHDARFADTAPASELMRPPSDSGAWAQTQPMRARQPLPQSSPLHAEPLFTLDAAMLVARRNNRVSPRPDRWLELWALLPPRRTPRGQQPPPPPPTGGAWKLTSALTKRLCLREHIEWADSQGVLEEVIAFLLALSEEDWLHMGED